MTRNRRADVPRWHLSLLGLLAVLALVARWPGTGHGIPHVSNPDERIHERQYTAFRAGEEHPEARTRFSVYPSVWARTLSLLPRGAPAPRNGELETELERAAHDTRFLRRATAVAGALGVPATWWLARAFTTSGWALWAAACVASSLLHLALSAQARPHAILTTAVALSLAASIAHVRRGTWRSALAAGLAVGGALAILQSGSALLLPLLVALGARRRDPPRRRAGQALLALGVAGVAFLASYPGLWLGRGEAQALASGHSGFLTRLDFGLHRFSGGGERVLWIAFADHDPLLLAAAAVAAIGLVVHAVRAGRRGAWPTAATWIVLAFALPYALILARFDATFVRFALPLVPILALLAAAGLERLGRAGLACAGIVLAGQAWAAIHYAGLLARPDTAQLAAAWIRANVDRERERIGVSPLLTLPLARNQESLRGPAVNAGEALQPWTPHLVALDPLLADRIGYRIRDILPRTDAAQARIRERPREYFAEQGIDVFVVDVHRGERRVVLQQLRAALRAHATLVASFAPQDGPVGERRGLDPFLNQEGVWDERFYWSMWSAERLGPWIEVYRFDGRR